MEEDVRNVVCLFSIILAIVHNHVSTVTSQEAPPSQHHKMAFFNESLGSSATLSSTLDLKGHIAFSFRTCSYGYLLQQHGAPNESGERDTLGLSLTPNGSLEMRWILGEQKDSVTVGQDSLRNNEWYTVDIKFTTGEIYLTVKQGEEALDRILVSNSSYRQYLWDLDLSGGSGIQVGVGGFSGCIQEGPSVQLSAADTDAAGVLWDECPLESHTVEGCDAPKFNPCWRYPCQNGGSCITLGENYRCNCPLPYSGVHCESDLGHQGCNLEPCRYGGTCEDVAEGTRRYRCHCQPGYTGVHCEIDIDECASSPCRHGGRCKDLIHNYTCECSNTGYRGNQCDRNIDECLELAPCLHGATCSDAPGSYICECPAGFGGDNCENETDNCISSPCLHDGTCRNFLGSFQCGCVEGYTGERCEVNIDDCAGVDCDVENSECVDGVNEYKCSCRPGYWDPNNSTGHADNCAEIVECSSSPCQNMATCEDLENYYTCICVPGFTGRHCETEVNECDSEPCKNGASCSDQLNAFTCECLDGFSGNTCDMNINECDSQPCENGATCNDLINEYNCSCAAGWEGRHCQIQIDECLSNPCQNDATCHDEVAYFTCECVLGFSGVTCETNIDDCDPPPCENAGVCQDGVNEYTCQCTDDWMGETCDQVYDACYFEPCLNNATCTTETPSHDYECTCLSGFTGDSCETNIDDCEGHDCLDYQVCVDGVNEYTCQCPVGYTGDRCEVEINECDSNPCQNGGTCTDFVGYYKCECHGELVDLTEQSEDPRSVYRIGFDGLNCEIEVDECQLQPRICLHGICNAAPINNPASDFGFMCSCDQFAGSYYLGLYCEYRKSYCLLPDEPRCQNGGTCTENGAESHVCECVAGYTGLACETDIDDCAESPCLNNGTCHDAVNAYSCECPDGLTGHNCETNIDECESDPCLNGGNCMDGINGYECNCTDTGFTGTHCDINIDECLSQPCQNGGSCSDVIKGYTCSCFDGYRGTHCEVDIDECAATPCQNGATCQQLSDRSQPDFSYETAAGYECQCVPGYEGDNCEIDIDECESNPCANGDCLDLVNVFECRCDPGWKGVQCDIEIDECAEYTPCKNSAQCTDLLADYTCFCAEPLTTDAVQYGGKNCTVELIGCGDNECLNNATCVPFLQDEGSASHNYTCDCRPGYAGYYCGVETTAQYVGSSWLKHSDNSGVERFQLSLEFRTTLPNGLLAINTRANDQNLLDYISLELIGGSTLQIEYQNSQEHRALKLQTPTQKMLNDAQWHKIECTSLYNELTLHLYHQDCPDGICSAVSQFPLAENGPPHHTIGDTYIGGAEESVSGIANFPQSSFYVGCMRDVVVTEVELIPEELLESSADVALGCPREEQCVPDPCNGNGECEDLWVQWQCQCRRPYFGESCDREHKAGTFSHEGADSYAKFAIPPDEVELLRSYLDLSLFFRTRETEGVLFYIGAKSRNLPEEQDRTFIAAQIQPSGVEVVLQLSPEMERFKIDGDFSSGEQHFLHIIRNYTDLLVTVDATTSSFEIEGPYPLNPQLVLFGGVPQGEASRRKRRQSEDDEPLFTGPPFKGTMQDMRQNNFLLPLFPSNDTDSDAPSYSEPEMQGVVEGEVSDDICAQQPCQNNGTCSPEFFNDFSCACEEGYRGKDCSLLAFCIYADCPTESTCVDLFDGHECVANATFENNGYLKYSNTLQNTPETITMTLRSRQEEGTLLHLRGEASFATNYLTLQLVNSQLLVMYNLGQSTLLPVGGTASDGEWREVTLEVQADEVILKLNDGTSSRIATQQTVTLRDILANVYLAGVPGSYRQNNPTMFETEEDFKGCLGEVRIGSVLLPFFSQSDLGTSQSAEQFKVTELENVEVNDCPGDPVCASHDCKNGATCEDAWNAYECLCVPGFNGTFCELNIDDCVGHACENGATCRDGIQDYTCDCVLGYTGDRCEEDINECASNPCQNNATCWDQVGEYTCNCSANYTGPNCEVLITATCDFEPCLNNATCIPVNNTDLGWVTFNCSCLPGYTGRYCESVIDYCEGQPCLNNATCSSHTSTQSYTCQCLTGYTGHDCETDIDECDPDPCQNGAICEDHVGSFECVCDDGWEGDTCEKDIEECSIGVIDGLPVCENGICQELPGSYHCNCTDTGYYGERCEFDINECDSDPCLNGGTCHNYNGTYNCSCTEGYEGDNCEIPNCDDIVCENNGNCTIEDGQWQCDCLKFYEGDYCEIKGPCLDKPCINGECVQEVEDANNMNYTCECEDGWQGHNCSEDIDECEDDPCVNGDCNNTNGSYECNCYDGFTGVHCEDDIDECASDPCVNGECIDDINGYNCTCDEGWTGTHCDEDIDECALDPQPCENGGTCVNEEPLFSCICTPDYIGNTCHSRDPCLDSADFCLNGGNCTSEAHDQHRNASLSCVCPDYYSGPNCEKYEPLVSPAKDDDLIPLIAGCAVGGLILIIIIVVIALIMVARNKRATRGAYSPSRQEMSGSRVEMGNQLKIPPEERLI